MEEQAKPIVALNLPKYYINRELSLLEFNSRVLAEAEDKSHPLLERLKFTSIFSSNLDEFFMIRVAGLKGQLAAGVVEMTFDGMSPAEQMKEIRKRLIPLLERQTRVLMDDILPALEKENIIIHRYESLSKDEKAYLRNYFHESVLPVLTPLSLDPAHPFPRLINRSLNVAFALCDKSKKASEKKVAILQLPSMLSRLVKLDRNDGHHFVFLEQIIKANAEVLFPGLTIEASNTFRVTRDADIEIAEDEAEDLLTVIAEQVKHRRFGTAVVRLEVSAQMPEFLLSLLIKSLDIDETDVYVHSRPLKVADLMELVKLDIWRLKDAPFHSRIPSDFLVSGSSLFDKIKKKDLLVHHPFDSFSNSVLKFLDTSAADPDVIAIKITLYRTGLNSPVVEALKRAAENGKEVIAFVELKARFDEENNIIWAHELEQVGVHVVYGVIGVKTHCKIAIAVRKEGTKLRTYLHLSTGNYNSVTSRLYTDVGYFTARPEFATDGIHLFNLLTGYSYQKEWQTFLVAPINLKKRIIELINREAELHTPENPGLIFVKMNALAHEEVIQALYRASQKGVKIKLIVRGVCCLIPGIPRVSDNIEVRSILGRFLEHSRVFYFRNGGNEEFYLSSADWMTRNLQRRIELMFPIKEPSLQKHLRELLDTFWSDNSKSWQLQSDGSYTKTKPKEGKERFSAQAFYLSEVMKQRRKAANKEVTILKSLHGK